MLVAAGIIMIFLFPLLGFVFLADGLKRTLKYGRLYRKLCLSPRTGADAAARERDVRLLRTMSVQLQTAATSAVSPQYVPTGTAWRKLRGAVMVSTLLERTKKKSG